VTFVELSTATSPELRELCARERVLGLLPVAALEQHGPHLPLANDVLIAVDASGSRCRWSSGRTAWLSASRPRFTTIYATATMQGSGRAA
jgi:Creatinine amidohydrolase